MKSKFDPQKRHRPFDGAQGRRSIRLKGYDYSSDGAYYLTIIAQGRECLFGNIIHGEMHPSKYGEIIQKWWGEIPVHFPNVELGAFIVMPNHVHDIIFIIDNRKGEVISPPDHPNANNQNVNIGDTYYQGGDASRPPQPQSASPTVVTTLSGQRQ